jgi:hypothetical protein
MLKWAMRIMAVSGALLALAVGTAAWVYRTQGREWEIVTPGVYSYVNISPRCLWVGGYRRSEWDWHYPHFGGRYSVTSLAFNSSFLSLSLTAWIADADFGYEWQGFGIIRGARSFAMHSNTQIFCPTWAAIAVLLLPTGLWAGVGGLRRGTA